MALPALQQIRKNPNPLFIWVLASISLLGPLVIHMFVPATPNVKATFGVSESIIGLTNSIPLFTIAICTLVYGSLSDRYGRRPLLLVGLLLFIFGSELAALADSIWSLIAGRFLQAAGGACGMALARAIARDVYGSDQLIKVLSYLLMAYAVGPMVSTPIGSVLTEQFGWRSVLVFASGLGLLIIALAYFFIPESHFNRQKKSERLSILASYIHLFKNLDFTAYVFQSGFSSGVFFSLLAAAAFLMEEFLGRPPSEFGLYFLLFPCGYWIGNFTSNAFSGRISPDIMVFAGSTIMIFTAVGLAALMVSGWITPLTIFVPGMLITFAQGMALPNSQAAAINLAGELAGTAAGIGTFMQFLWAAVFIQLYSVLDDGTPIPMVIAVSVAASLAFAAGTIPFLRARS